MMTVKKYILILGKSQTDGLDDTTLTVEKVYSISFTEHKRIFCRSFYHNRANSFVFFNGVEIYKLKAKDSEINASPLCLENFLKDFSVDNMKKAGLYEYAHGFSVGYGFKLLVIY